MSVELQTLIEITDEIPQLTYTDNEMEPRLLTWVNFNLSMDK